MQEPQEQGHFAANVAPAERISTVRSASRWINPLVYLGLFITMVSWSLSMPLGAAPDEAAHIIKAAAVSHGQLLGESIGVEGTLSVQVPSALANAQSWTCFAFNSEVSAACQELAVSSGEMAPATTAVALYNPVYYALVGWPSLFLSDPTAIVWSMRALTALVSAGLSVVILALLRRFTSTTTALFLTATILTPMVVFLSSSVNPNSWEILGCAAFLVGLLWFGFSGASLRGPGIGVATFAIAGGGFLAATSRGVSPFWLFLMGLLFLAVTPRPRTREIFASWRFLWPLTVAVLASVLSIIWTLRTGTLGGLIPLEGADRPLIVVFAQMVLPNARLYEGMIGNFGWLDTPAPALVFSVYGLSVIGVLLAGVSIAGKKWRVVTAVSVVLVLLAPALVQLGSLRSTGYIWQGRYSLPLLVAALLLAGFGIIQSGRSWDKAVEISAATYRRFTGGMLLLMLLAQGYAFYVNLFRNSVGTLENPLRPLLDPAWQPAVLGVGGVVFLYGCGAILLLVAGYLAARQLNGENLRSALVQDGGAPAALS